MYGYLSLLNFLGHFDSIQVNYLIVGHTHGPIDQYFSVLTNKLWGTAFVGSPMALQCLFMECENPQVNRQIWVHRDWKGWLEKILNHSLKFISLPHVVLFTRELTLSILQHKAFSTKDQFLPLKPEGARAVTDKADLAKYSAKSLVILEELGQLGGLSTVYKEFLGTEVTLDSLIKNPEINKTSNLLNSLLPKLYDIDRKSAVESVAQLENESQVSFFSI